jgi:hypothetical protein
VAAWSAEAAESDSEASAVTEALAFPPPLPEPAEAAAWSAEPAESVTEAITFPPPLPEPPETAACSTPPPAETAPEALDGTLAAVPPLPDFPPLPELPQDPAPDPDAELPRVIPFPAQSESAPSPERAPESGLRVKWAVLGGTAAGIGAGLLAIWLAAGK